MNDMRLTLTAQRQPDRLRVEFAVINEGRQPYYVFTCAAGGLREPLPHRAYTAYNDVD